MVNPVCYRFGSFELQPMERRLLEAGAPVAVGPRAFRVLVVLVERAGQLVTKDELLAAVWPRVVVEENALQAQISALRKILSAKAIATVSRSGYRFELTVDTVAPVSAVPKHNLPEPVTSFIGRAREMLEIERLLESTRVLTLTGAGGCGKTRLALRVATALLLAYSDGVRFVELSAVADARLVPQAAARALGVRERQGRTLTEALCDHLADARTLVLLDNAEHLLEACAALVGDIIRACPQVRVLVTSRERLDIAGEVTYRVPSFSVPSGKQLAPDELIANESVRLFVDRAQLVRPHFRATEDNAATLASVCRRLDGIPLAIELAAPRLRAMSLEEMDARLDRCLSLLTSGSRSALPRHRTLRSLFDWSYDLLSASEQALLRRLSCFAGGATLEAAEQVCAGEGIEAKDILDLLTSLVDKSLVMADEAEGATRYALLETVRQYAGELERETETLGRWQARHFDFYFDVAERARLSTVTADHAKWLKILDAEHDNLRAALAWSGTAEANVSQGLRLGAALWRFWWMRGYCGEGGKALLALLAIAPESLDPPIRLEALTRAALLLAYAADFPTAGTLFESALALARAIGDQRALAQALNSFGAFQMAQGDYVAARRASEEVIEIWRALDDRRALGGALGNLAITLCQMGDLTVALGLHEQSLAIRRQFDDRWAIATELHNFSTTLRELGDLVAARKASEEALAIYRELGDVPLTAAALGRLGSILCDQGTYTAARRCLNEGVRLFAETGNRVGIENILGIIGYACMNEEPERAACLWGAAERLREELGASRSIVDAERYRKLEGAARAAMADDEAFDTAWRSGRAFGFQATVDYALEMTVRPNAGG
jgi:non-specific serine/threonine protein kinase